MNNGDWQLEIEKLGTIRMIGWSSIDHCNMVASLEVWHQSARFYFILKKHIWHSKNVLNFIGNF